MRLASRHGRSHWAGRARDLAGVCAGIIVTAGCASVPIHFPDLEDFVYPVPETGTLRAEDARRLDAAWRDIVRARPASAEKQLTRLQSRYPRAAAPSAGLGYACLRAGRLEAARDAFQVALRKNAGYLPALAGAATVARRLGDADAAVELYRRAAEADRAGPGVIRRRLGEAKLEATERHVHAARKAVDAGQPDRAASEYRLALRAAPEVGGVRIELADILMRSGDATSAMDVLLADPTGDRQVLLSLGAILSGTQQHVGAAEVYERLLARDPSDEEARRLAAEARRADELVRMPEEYRRIFEAQRVTRADLASLMAIKITAMASLPVREPPVATDISGSWARAEILRVLGAGIMDVFPNHTFQPAASVRRGELAQTVARVLDLFGQPRHPAPLLPDLPHANLFYEGAARSVAEGLMDLTPEGHFEPWRPVTGAEAVAVIEGLARRVRPAAQTPGQP
jgi:tetratricopeptide (TPR) repeat protein